MFQLPPRHGWSVMTDQRIAYLALEAPRVGQASHVHVSEIIAGLERRGWAVRLYSPSDTKRAVKPTPPSLCCHARVTRSEVMPV